MSDKQSTTWKSSSGYIWSLIGSAVGFANILSFSAQVYKNGGGAFLIPYCAALFLLGVPLLLLEGLIGYLWKSPLVTAYGIVWGKNGKILGWLAVLACLTIGAFYTVLTGYSAAYTWFSATNQIPEDSGTFFVHSFLQTTSGITDLGGFSLPIFLSLAAVILLTWFVLLRNVRDGIEKVCILFMPLLAIIMTTFAIVVCFLPGGLQGWVYYLKPDFTRLYDSALWRDIFGQLFFSLSLGLGIVVGYSRHTGKNTNIGRAMIWVALGDFAVSFIAGAAIFGCLAYISFTQNIPFDSILTSDSTFEIGFILFPKILKFFGPVLSPIIGTIFFFCIFIAGITGVFSIVESIVGNIQVEFKTSRKVAVSLACFLLITLGSIFCLGNASYVIDALVPMVMGTNMLIGGLSLVLAFVYSCSAIRNNPVWMRKPGSLNIYGLSLRYIAPILLGTILIGNFWQEFQSIDLAKSLRWIWLLLALIISLGLSRISKKQDEKVSLSEIPEIG